MRPESLSGSKTWTEAREGYRDLPDLMGRNIDKDSVSKAWTRTVLLPAGDTYGSYRRLRSYGFLEDGSLSGVPAERCKTQSKFDRGSWWDGMTSA